MNSSSLQVHHDFLNKTLRSVQLYIDLFAREDSQQKPNTYESHYMIDNLRQVNIYIHVRVCTGVYMHVFHSIHFHTPHLTLHR